MSFDDASNKLPCVKRTLKSFKDDFNFGKRLIGKGAFGRVYLVHGKHLTRFFHDIPVWDTGEKEKFVMKAFDPLVYDRFNKGDDYIKLRKKVQAEVDLLQIVHSRAPKWTPRPIVCVEVFDESKKVDKRGQFFVWVQFLIFMAYEGKPLYRFWRSPEFPVKEFEDKLIQGVGQLHLASIVHNDVKPSNITLQFGRGSFKLTFIDMGGACLLDEGSELKCPYNTNITPGYFHPDIYSYLLRIDSMEKRKEKGCLASIHDWYGVIGVLYEMRRLRIREYLSKEEKANYLSLRDLATNDGYPKMSYNDVIKFFKIVFKEDPFIMSILNLPVMEFIDEKVSLKDMCKALNDIDNEAAVFTVRDGPSPVGVADV